VAQKPGLPHLWSYTRNHTGRLILALAFALAGIGATLVFPLVTKWLLDAVGEGASIRQPVIALIVLFVVSAVLVWMQQVIVGRIGEDIVADSRSRLLRTVFHARVLPVLSWSPGELSTRLTNDTSALRDSTASSLLGVISAAALALGTVIVMAFLDWRLLLVSVAAIIVVVLVTALTMPLIATARKQAQAATGELGANFTSAVRAIKTIKATRAEQSILIQLASFIETARTNGIRAVHRLALATTLGALGIQTGLLIVLAYGGLRVATGEMESSTLVAFLLYFFGLISPVLELTSSLGNLQTGIASAERLSEVDQLPQESTHPGESTADELPTQARNEPGRLQLQLKDVVAGYDAAVPTLRGVSLQITATGHYALVGLSGAGKSTLFNVLLGFMPPDHGSIHLKGTDYADLGVDTVRNQFALVEQDTPLLCSSIRQNLTLGKSTASDEELRETLRAIGLQDRIAGLPNGLDSNIEDTSLSGGERQRLALARALLLNRPILLLDEATAQLDGLTEKLVTDTINRHAQTGVVISIAHRLSTVMDADRIFLMNDGEIADAGTHQELRQRNELYRSFLNALRIESQEHAEPVEAT